jgi:hypothetical protein
MTTRSTHKVTLTPEEEFFFAHAGYSHDPEHETRTSGRTRGAILLAHAASEAKRRGWSATWDIDQDADTVPTDSYFVSGAPHWECLLTDADGTVLASLSSIDLGFAPGSDSEPKLPYGDSYATVVEAELALEALGNL